VNESLTVIVIILGIIDALVIPWILLQHNWLNSLKDKCSAFEKEVGEKYMSEADVRSMVTGIFAVEREKLTRELGQLTQDLALVKGDVNRLLIEFSAQSKKLEAMGGSLQRVEQLSDTMKGLMKMLEGVLDKG